MSLFRVRGHARDGLQVEEFVECGTATSAAQVVAGRLAVDPSAITDVKMVSDHVMREADE